MNYPKLCAYMAEKGVAKRDVAAIIISMVVSFYFGTQSEKKPSSS